MEDKEKVSAEKMYEDYEALAANLAYRFWGNHKQSLKPLLDFDDFLQIAKMSLWKTICKVDSQTYDKNQVKKYIRLKTIYMIADELRTIHQEKMTSLDAFDFYEDIVDHNAIDPAIIAEMREKYEHF